MLLSLNVISLPDLVTLPVCEHCTMTSNNVQDTYTSAYSSTDMRGGGSDITQAVKHNVH